MRIISTTDLNREGNDCYIESSISLMEDRNLYFVILVEKVLGYPYTEKVIICGEPSTNRITAEFYYKDYGGIIKDEPHIRMYDSSTGRG